MEFYFNTNSQRRGERSNFKRDIYAGGLKKKKNPSSQPDDDDNDDDCSDDDEDTIGHSGRKCKISGGKK